MSERRFSLSVVPEAARELKPSLPSSPMADPTATGAAAPTRKHSFSSAAMVAAVAAGGLAPSSPRAAHAARKPSFTSAAMAAAVAVHSTGAAASPRERKASLTPVGAAAASAAAAATMAMAPATAGHVTRKPSNSNDRRPSLASVGTAAAVAVGTSSRLPFSTAPPAVAATGTGTSAGGLARAPSPRHMSTVALASPSSSSSSVKKSRPQQLVQMKATRRSFSSSGSLDAQRIELFFHLPTHKELQRLRVHKTLTLIGLQALVQRDFAIPFEDQRLYWHGDLLEGDEDLAFYDIHDQSVLNLRVRKRYRPIGDIFTKVKTVQFPKHPHATPDDYEIVEVVAPLPPTHVLFKRLVAAITYLQRLDVLQAQRTQRRVWKQRVAFWDESAVPTVPTSGRRRSSLVPLQPVPSVKSVRSRSTTSTTSDASERDAVSAPVPVPPGFIKLHSGPERVSYVVSLAQTHAIAQRLQLPGDQRAPSDLRHIKKWLGSLKFFASASLPDTAMHEIARACTYVRYAAGDFLFRQGDVGDHFYIVISGCVSLAAYGNGLFATMTPGQCFGEISLFAGTSGRRTASATVNFAAPCAELALLSGDMYRRVLTPFKKAVLQTTEKALYAVPQLRTLPDHIVTHIAYASKKLEAKNGRVLVRRGEDMNVLVLLITGEVKVSTATATPLQSSPPSSLVFPVVSVVRAPAVLCQEAVLTNTPAPAPWDIEALDHCTLLCLRTDTISIFLAPRPDIIRALYREHTQRIQDFERRFAPYAPPPPTAKDEKTFETTPSEASSRRRSRGKLSRKASYVRFLASRIFESQRSLLGGAEQHGRKRRGAAAHVQCPKILLRRSANNDAQRDEDLGHRELDLRGDHRQRPDGAWDRPWMHTSPVASPSCATLQDAFLHRALPFGNILDLPTQIQFCSFAVQELQEQDHRGRTRALLRGLRQQPVEEVAMVPSSEADGMHFRFAPRPPTSPATIAPSSSPLGHFHFQRRHLQTR